MKHFTTTIEANWGPIDVDITITSYTPYRYNGGGRPEDQMPDDEEEIEFDIVDSLTGLDVTVDCQATLDYLTDEALEYVRGER